MKNQISESDYLERLGARITKLRKRRGMSQRELAKEIGILPNSLKRIEKGQTNTTVRILRRIWNVLDASPNDLMDFE